MTVRVFTDHKARELLTWWDLEEEDRKPFDYLEDDEKWSSRFVKYRGEWYDVGDVQVINGGTIASFPVSSDSPLFGWNGIQSDSVWTGVVFRWLTDKEAYDKDLDTQGYIIVGRYSE